MPRVDAAVAPRTLAGRRRLDFPALLFLGDMDPVTPPRMGDEVVKTLRRGRHVVLLNNAHALGASYCPS